MLDPQYQSPPQLRRILPVLLCALAILFTTMWLAPLKSRVQGQTGSEVPVTQSKTQSALWPISIDYPEDHSIFPPGITPPTFLWRDGSATSWRLDVTFGEGVVPLHFESKGQRMHLGDLDPECVSATNEPPHLSAQQAASWAWTPDAATWRDIQNRSANSSAKLVITGYRDGNIASSQASISFSTSIDPVGAPIFYRDVPLMPSAGANGTVQPLSPELIHLIRWRLKDIRSPESRTVLTNMPTCANCHSFSGDGKTMGIDVDGPANDKGLYAIVPVQRHISIQSKDVVQWNTDGQAGKVRVGFMSQISPDGRYIIGTFSGASTEDVSNTYYVTNFKDYRFLQVFYPTRGILEWYDRTTGKRQPLPGADDPRYVQTDGVWSPDGKYIVFARAEAKDPYPEGQKKAIRANDPNETQIQYDLYRIPFNEGKGGTPEPIAGASLNGMSNNFPKVSPDGRWIVFVQCRNGQLMRPDSQLYIVPALGGVARRLRANTPLMNSWHSFSPNGHWLVFSSKSRSPYTQMYLTHLDSDGNSSPPILIDNTTASNRAVNLPEFVNIPGDGIEDIQVPAVELYKLMDQATQLQGKGDNDQALALWKRAVSIDPRDAKAQNGLGVSLFVHGDVDEAFNHLRRAIEINPLSVQSHYILGTFLLKQGHAQLALTELQRAVAIRPHFESGEEALATAYSALGNSTEAVLHWRKAHSIDPSLASAKIGLAWILATDTNASVRNGAEAVALAESTNNLDSAPDPNVLDVLGAAYAETMQFPRAIESAKQAIDLAASERNERMAKDIRARLLLYRESKPYRSDQTTSRANQLAKSAAVAKGSR